MEIYNDFISIHYDCDGVLRDFHTHIFKIFFEKYPKYKKYILPVKQFRGWEFKDQLKKVPEAKKINDMIWELFEDEEMAFRIFGEAPTIVSPDEWERHIEMIKKKFPNASITISTHQYTDFARMSTTYWLYKNGFTKKDEINILYTGEKDKFGAHFLLDDKPQTIQTFKKIGVLRLNERTNGWYVRLHKGKFPFPTAKNLDDYYNIINEKVIELL